MSTYWCATMTPWMRRRSVCETGHVGLAGDQQRRGLQDDGAEDLQPLLLERGAGLDDVGDRIRDAEPDRGLDRPIQTHHGRFDTLAREEVAHQPVVAGRDADAREVLQLGEAVGGSGEPERRCPEVELVDLDGLRVRVQQQVAARDADVERTGTDVGRDIARAQVEELDVVARVGDGQFLGVAPGRVPGLLQHLDRGV